MHHLPMLKLQSFAFQIFFGGRGNGAPINSGTSSNKLKWDAFLDFIVGKVVGNEELVKTIYDELRALKGDVSENESWIWGLAGALFSVVLWILAHCKAVIHLIAALL